MHDLEEFALSGYCDAVHFVRGDRVLVVRMCSLIVRSRRAGKIEPEHDFHLVSAKRPCFPISPRLRLTPLAVRWHTWERLDRTDESATSENRQLSRVSQYIDHSSRHVGADCTGSLGRRCRRPKSLRA